MSITIKDVAREAGVSPSTVSKIINNSPTISKATIQRVQEVMEQMHYYPNAQARNFAQKTTRNIVFLTKLEEHTAFTNPHMFEIMCGVQEALAKKEYNLSFVSVQQADEAAVTVERIIAQKSADGLVVHGSATTRSLALLLVKSGFPHVIIGKPDFESQVCWIDTNNHLSGQIAAEHLCDCGFKRIAFVGGEPNGEISMKRLKGFTTVMKEKSLAVPPGFIKYGDSTKMSGFILTNELLDGPNCPEAIICENNNIALGVVKSINEHGLKIPDNIALICFDDFPLSRMIDPTPTIVDIDVHDLGVQAGSILIRKIKNPALQVQTYTTLPNLIVRDSTKRLI